MICLQIGPKLSANVASSWNSRLQHSVVSAGLDCIVYCSKEIHYIDALAENVSFDDQLNKPIPILDYQVMKNK